MDGFFPERQIVQATVDGIFFVGFRVLITRYDLELRSLG